MPILVEAALRSLLVAALVAAALRILRVRNVVAEKTAWAVVLAAAFLMPLLMPAAARWPAAELVVHADPMTLLEELQARIRAKSAAPQAAAVPAPQTLAGPVATQAAPKPRAAVAAALRKEVLEQPAGDGDPQTADISLAQEPPASAAPQAAMQIAPAPAAPRLRIPSAATSAALLYALVALALVGRLLAGLFAALVLRHRARPIALEGWLSSEPLDLRVSEEVSSPVTIGSSVVLPADCAEWSAEKLRIVLAHERSHIHQKDFYLQLLAGLYAAVVWFSPLGWWIRARLSDLAEAISDRAGLDEAASRTSYAQLLLEFAAAPRPTPIGVAMARPHRLTRRIERLLNDTAFRQSFAGSRRTLAAALVLPAALMLSAALVRVQAAGQDAAAPATPQNAPSPAAPQAVPSPAAPATPVAVPDATPAPEPREGQAAPEPDDTIAVPSPAPAAQAAPVPQAPPAPQTAPAPEAMPAPPSPPDQPVILEEDDAPVVLAMPRRGDVLLARPDRMTIRKDADGDSYVIVHGSGQMTVDNTAENDALQKARKMTKGDFVLYTHQGKSYIIDDPATVAQIDAAMEPMHLLAFRAKMLDGKALHMEEMQKRMAERQKEFAKQQQTIILRQKEWQDKQQALTATELKKQMQELNETVAKLEARQNQKLTNEDLAELRSEVAELQAKLSGFPMHFELQTVAMPKVDFPKITIDIDKQMAEAQKQVAEAQKRMQQESDQKMKSIIDESLKDGKAKPIQ
ncbi:MAG TPA: M56 family metallopeptidase [Terracidiphilus sp.]|nr:M56 family metallopeptidase [Terracidiphilus sp.]